MRVQFEYSVSDGDGVEYWLDVEAEVDLGTTSVVDRRPEHCEPGESPSAEVTVLDANGVELSRADLKRLFGPYTHHDIVREAIAVAQQNARR